MVQCQYGNGVCRKALLTHESGHIDWKTIETASISEREASHRGRRKQTPAPRMYVDKRVLPTQELRWEIPYVLGLTIRFEMKVVKRGLTEHPGLPATPLSGPLSDWSARSANAK